MYGISISVTHIPAKKTTLHSFYNGSKSKTIMNEWSPELPLCQTLITQHVEANKRLTLFMIDE